MIRYETYEWIAQTFGCDVGVAEFNGSIYDIPNSVSKMSDDLKYVVLTRWMIHHNIYQKVQRELYRLERKYKTHKTIKQITLLTKAMDIVIEREGININE